MNKKSKQRQAILRVVRSTDTHPTAEWIYEHVREEIPGIGLATVYRNLRVLKDAGKIEELHGTNGTARFDANLSPHYHFFCDRCGSVVDLKLPVDTEIESRIAGRTGLKVTQHHLLLRGLCLHCQQLETGMHKDS